MNKQEAKNVLQLVNRVRETMCQKQIMELPESGVQSKIYDISKENLLLSISGGQDSIFLVFLFELFRNQIELNFSLLWCNHFWQSNSFYTTLHITKTAFCFFSRMLAFIPCGKKKTEVSKQKFTPPKKHLISPAHVKFYQEQITSKTYFYGMPCKHYSFKQKREILYSSFSNTSKSYIICKKIDKTNIYKAQQNKKTKNKSIFNSVVSEQSARNWRHLVTDRACLFYKHSCCMHGHTQSDRVETVFFNLIRGAGIQGVTVVQWQKQYSSFSFNRLYPSLERAKIETYIT